MAFKHVLEQLFRKFSDVDLMKRNATLWDMEERFWTQGAESARQMTDKDAVFVFPDPTGVLQGDRLWQEADVAQRWRSVVMSERHVLNKSNIAVLTYRVSAERGDDPAYQALCSSLYINTDGKWLRQTHQQTPLLSTLYKK